MSESWYNLIMSLSGILILAGIVLTWLIRKKIERISGEENLGSLLLLIGGVLTSIGFLEGVAVGENLTGVKLVLILIGPALVGYGLFSIGFAGTSSRLIIQSAILLSSLLGAGHYSTVPIDIAYVGPFLAVLMLINAQILMTKDVQRTILIVSSWLLTIFSWTRYWLDNTSGIAKALIVIPYFASIIIWIGVMVSLYISISPGNIPLPENAQEGL
ncbi:hypothetical protein [Thermococcus sp.]